MGVRKLQSIILSAVCLTFVLGNAQAAKVIWHCSKASVVEAASKDTDSSWGMGGATANGMIAVTLDDLYSVYGGYPMRVAGKPLFACFMPGREELSAQALDSLGASSAAMQMLARRSAIVQRNLMLVTDEEEMLLCMERNAPAFGYLSEAIDNDKVGPCF